MTVRFDCYESDGKVKSVAKTIGVSFCDFETIDIATFSQLMKGENRSALQTDRVSVARNKSNVATAQTGFRKQSILAVALSMWFL